MTPRTFKVAPGVKISFEDRNGNWKTVNHPILKAYANIGPPKVNKYPTIYLMCKDCTPFITFFSSNEIRNEAMRRLLVALPGEEVRYDYKTFFNNYKTKEEVAAILSEPPFSFYTLSSLISRNMQLFYSLDYTRDEIAMRIIRKFNLNISTIDFEGMVENNYVSDACTRVHKELSHAFASTFTVPYAVVDAGIKPHMFWGYILNKHSN